MSVMDLLHEIVSEEQALFIACFTLVAVCALLTQGISKVVVGVSRERTKREIAAYVAEGAMSPEQAERLLKSHERPQRSC